MRRALVLVVIAVALSGCRQGANFDATRTIAKTAADSRDVYDALATDYYDSCMRRLQLDSIADGVHSAMQSVGSDFSSRSSPAPVRKSPVTSALQFPPELSARQIGVSAVPDIVRLATEERLATLDSRQFVRLIDREDFPEIERLFSDSQRGALESRARSIEQGHIYGCRQAALSSEQWRKTNDIFIGYFVALGNLAGSSAESDRYDIGALATQLHKSEIIPNDPAPLANVVNGLIRANFDAKRRGALADFMTAGSPLIDDCVKRLSDAARKHYIANQLRQERDSLETFLLLNRKYAKPGADAFAVYVYAKAWKDERQAVDVHEIAANAYVSSLAKLAGAHERILQSLKSNNLASALGDALAYATDVRSDLDAIDKAFEKKK